jgi:chorismate mutase
MQANYGVKNVPGTELDAVGILRDLRDSIDNIDAAIIRMLAERFRCTQRVGILKAQNNLAPSDPERETQQIARLRRLAFEAKLDPDFAEQFLRLTIREVIRRHEVVALSGA